MTKNFIILIAFFSCILLHSCNEKNSSVKGTLFIIGGGNRTEAMMNELADISGIRHNGYIFILPMASSLPDSAIIWAREDFGKTGISNVTGYCFRKNGISQQSKLDSLRNANLIYICGGDQSRFMAEVLNTPVMEAIHEAYEKGAVIAGTSAGAAVMSKKMITGNQKKHPEEEGVFATIEEDNIEITEGLGLLPDVIIDQHFIKRQRLNRLIAVSIENPDQLCVGIDESTAIIITGNTAVVTGNSQVVVIENKNKVKDLLNGLLGAQSLELSVFLPGQKFKIR
jgi:cyanophycinase